MLVLTGAAPGLCVALRARAKVNLRLEVVGLRADGYHEVVTILHSLELADAVKLRLRPGTHGPGPTGAGHVDIKLHCLPDLGIEPEANLAQRAARTLLDAWFASGGSLPADLSLTIEIAKRVPVAAGLGGGSADAAAVLRGLSALLQAVSVDCATSHGRINLPVLAEALGSDVPFMVRGGAALGVGRGERLLPLESALTSPVLLLVPPFGVSAASAYAWYDEMPQAAHGSHGWYRPLPCGVDCLAGLDALADGLVHNDLTSPVAARHKLLDQLIEAARQSGAVAAGMTGSGPVVFGVFATSAQAKEARHELARSYPHVRVLRTRLDPAVESEPLVIKEERV